MTRDAIIKELKEKTAAFDGASYKGFLALQITLKDLNEVFYIEIKGGKLSIEPYEYNDRQANMIISSKDFVKLINGKLNSVIAFTTGKLKIEGDIQSAKELANILKGD
ncbi:MAG: SCP2 sterol-binding domain-containing protein [Oscillospiraceae bacterium]|nr:SCP2 sterol-binding domain-containing protein [Oscillospiraceae bacterium]